MKPFNLEQALAGKPVVTRDGREVIELRRFPITGTYPLIGVIRGDSEASAWRIDGTISQYTACAPDLFMAPVKKILWINLYSTATGAAKQTGGYAYNTEAEAKKYSSRGATTVSFEIEE